MKKRLGENDSAPVYTAFPSIVPFLNRAIGYGDIPTVIAVHTMYSDVLDQQLHTKLHRDKKRIGEVVSNEIIQRLKMLAQNLFEEMENSNLLTFTLHVSDHIPEDE